MLRHCFLSKYSFLIIDTLKIKDITSICIRIWNLHVLLVLKQNTYISLSTCLCIIPNPCKYSSAAIISAE